MSKGRSSITDSCEEVSTSRIGSTSMDSSTVPPKMMVATANVNTLAPNMLSSNLAKRCAGLAVTGRIQIFEHMFDFYGMDVVGLQECRTSGDQMRYGIHYIAYDI